MEALSDQVDDVRQALIAIRGFGDDAFDGNPELCRRIKPLVEALRRNDHDLVVRALWHRTMTEHEKNMIVLQNAAYLVAVTPKTYGVEKLTKTDVIEILRVSWPDLAEFLPTSKRGLTDFWEAVGVNLGQGRGAISRNLKKWLADCASKAE